MSDTRATRTEHDTLGAMEVPSDALFGAQTARAVANFPISGWRMPETFLEALALIKWAFARANGEGGRLPAKLAEAIAGAAEEVAAGRHHGHFPVDVFQTGSGTSTNMNMNEVLSHLANASLGGMPAEGAPVHPNDHVNLGQSSNDVIPAALRVAALVTWRDRARPPLEGVRSQLARLADANTNVVTLGRTHLMDAVPTTYGQVFDAWERRLAAALAAAEDAARPLCELPLGGTAVGTGIGGDPAATRRAVALLGARTRLPLETASNPAAEIQAQERPIAFAEALGAVARVLASISHDVRLRASGPFGGLGELELPAVQPGSSIMPGKVNPVIPEAVIQASIEVEGLASACRATATLHQLDLSLANPLLAWNLDTMARLLAGAAATLAERCLAGLEVNRERARSLAMASPALATALAARLGYDRAAEVAKEAERHRETVAVAARRLQVLPEAELDRVLDLDDMARRRP